MLEKIILGNSTEHKEFKLPFDISKWSLFNRYLKYLIDKKRNVSIKMHYSNNKIKEENIICETN